MKKANQHISLADVMRRAGRSIRSATSDELQTATPPTFDDLAQCLLFSPGDGRIWLNDQRMLLLHTSSLGDLRKELVEALGVRDSRALLTRAGYTSGARDAELVRRQWPDTPLASAFNAGPRLHSLEGNVRVTTVRFEFDVDKGSFFGEYLWHDSSEASEYIAAHGISSCPTCWMQIGYASGYASAFIGKLVVYREVECLAMGAPHCRVIGRPAAEWSDDDEDVSYFRAPRYKRSSADRQAQANSESSTLVRSPGTNMGGERPVIGLSASFLAARHMLERVASTNATVLFTGESGVGKELFSRILHDMSPRSTGPFVAVNCAAIPESLLEAELFGVERGAFTGAIATRPGRFERASGGTLLLDEVGCLSPVAQSKLLRVLQEGEIERVGSVSSLRVDVRVVGATNISLRREVEKGTFREDLFFRLNVFPIELPPLRERRDDIPLLLEHCLGLYTNKHDRRIPGFTRRAIEALLSYDYPGNIRELQNLIERGIICATDDEPLDVAHIFRQGEVLRPGAFSVGPNGALRETLEGGAARGAACKAPMAGEELAAHALDSGVRLADFEDQLCTQALDRAGGNVAKAARSLGITRAQLDYRIAGRAKRPHKARDISTTTKEN